MFPTRRFYSLSAAFAATLALSGAVFGQDVISAKSGLVHYVEGDVSIDGKPLAERNGTFSEVRKDGELSTALGRAEILLTPGVFLRVGENSSIRMRATALDDTQVEFVSGKAMVESDTPMKDNRVTVSYKDYAVTPVDHGLYEFTSEPPTLQVYMGEADVTAGGQTVRVKAGHRLIFTAALAQERFNDKDGDSLYRWSKLRSEYVSVANVSAARQAQGSSSYAGGSMGSWFYNPFYNMYTFLPFSGMMFSPFGFGFYSPYAFNQFYNPYYGYGYGGGGYYSGPSSGSANGGSKSGGGGWQRSLNHPVHPTNGAVVASSHGSSGGSSSGSGYSQNNPWNASSAGNGPTRSGGFVPASSGSMGGHAGGGSTGGHGK